MKALKTFQGPVALAFVAAIAVVLLPVSAAMAQTGEVQGVVFSDQGQPLIRAPVVVKGTDLKTVTDDNGQFTLSGVPTGAKTLEVALKGFRTETVRVNVTAGQPANADFILVPDLMGSEEIVVTAQQPDKKIRSSAAISTLSAEAIEERAPRNTADLIAAVPGFFAESSGGEVGNNLFVRGLPQGGSYRYVAMMEDGMPVFDSTELFFVNNDIFVRVDENIERMEAVRGGNAALYGSNAPGGLINFISKTGGDRLAGSIKATAGTANLYRLDGNVNGPAAENLFFSLGGFYRFDEGIRDPGFAASNGGQAKGSLMYKFGGGDDEMSGHARVTLKYMNDRNAFYLPVPFRGQFDSAGRLTGNRFVEGFPVDGTMTTVEGINAQVPLGNGQTLTMPLDDGQQQIGGSGMAELRFYFPNGRWEIQENFRYVQLRQSWNAILPFEIHQRDEWARTILKSDTTPYRFVCTDNGSPVGSSDCSAENDLVSLSGQWLVNKPVDNISNQLRLTKFNTIGSAENRITAGLYLGRYNARNTWYFNDILTDVQNRPHFLDLQILDGSGRSVTQDGFRKYMAEYVGGRGTGTIAALFAGDEINFGDKIRLDVSGRLERDTYDQDVEVEDTVDLGDPLTSADDKLQRGTGEYRNVTMNFVDWALSAGANYSLTDNASLYVRGSRGYKMPILDQYMTDVQFNADGSINRDHPSFPDVPETLMQVEAGVKMASKLFGLSAVAYWVQVEDFPVGDAVVQDPNTGEVRFVNRFAGKARTYGAELEGAVQPVPFFRANAALTLQDPRYVEFAEAVDPNDPSSITDFAGKQVKRLPRVISDVTATFMYRGASLGLNWSYTGHRFSNNANTIDLPGYNVFNAMASYGLGKFSLDFHVHNVLNGYGLTEGNPRRDEALEATPDIFLARPVLPRRFTFSVTGRL